MKVIKQRVYKVEYKRCYEDFVLVEADSIVEAMEVAKSSSLNLTDEEIIGVHTYIPVIKKLTKTITVEL